jgi:prepilin-type N-terminal cleavage/methylation domain-containing protein
MRKRSTSKGFLVEKVSTGSIRELFLSGHHHRGFTILELIVVVGVVVLLMAVAAPNFTDWRENAKVKSSSRSVAAHLKLAMVEATKRNENVVVAFSTTDTASGWGKGSYEAFVDDGGTTGNPAYVNNMVRDGDEALVLSEKVRMPAGVTLYTADFDLAGVSSTATGFNSRGLPLATADGTANDGVEIRNNKSSRYYRILIRPAGSVFMQMSVDGTNWQ